MDSRSRLQELLPKLVLAPSFLIVLVFVYGFIAYTGFLSLTDSKMLPSYNFVGLSNYSKLWALPHWWRAISNLAIFASLYIVICSVLGLALAILLDQKIRAEGILRPIYLYPMALSFIVTGTAWKWILNPGLGLENMQATPSIYVGLQLILPGETAPNHKHTPMAVRFVIEGEGGYTVVQGEKLPMAKASATGTPSTWIATRLPPSPRIVKPPRPKREASLLTLTPGS